MHHIKLVLINDMTMRRSLLAAITATGHQCSGGPVQMMGDMN